MELCTVLMAEDEDEWSDFVSLLLPSDQYRVLAVRTAKEALKLAGETRPDFAILDLNLPDMFGMDLCRSLRKMPGLDNLPVLALSSLEQNTMTGFETELDGYVEKPSAPRYLLATVELIRRRFQPPMQ